MLLLFLLSFITCAYTKPNFVVIITDDQDVELGGMKPMTHVKSLIGDMGVTFTNSYVTSPVCCPSRASFLSGRYVHNHHTYNNTYAGGCYGATWQRNENNTFAALLHREGYSTFYAGKYLNQYGRSPAGDATKVPVGWSEWHGLVGNSRYYNYTLSNDGVPTHSTDLYLTDVIRSLGMSFIENQTESAPFLMVLAPPAPHAPFTPATRHAGVYKNVTAPRTPNFNVAVDDKHWLITMPPSPLPESMMPELDSAHRSRWETLLAVDEMVADIILALDTQGMLDDTYVIYTSDNGYHIGQFAQVYDKRQPYESDIKVPLLIRGPNIKKQVKSNRPVLNIDLAPTILKLAGVRIPEIMDGHPIEFDLKAVAEERDRDMLVEYHGEGGDGTVDNLCRWAYDSNNLAQCQRGYACKCQDSRNNTYACLLHKTKDIDVKYCLFADNVSFNEIYDLNQDPYELENIAGHMFPAIKHWYHLLLTQLRNCAGAEECDNPVVYDDKIVNTV